MKTLDEIAINFKTDKSSLNHNYTKLYSIYFDPVRQEKLKIFEIGIDKGFSLKTWQEYFYNSEITGMDIINLKHLEKERTHIIQGDQKDKEILTKINDTYGPFDIIIDDGSHNDTDVEASFKHLFPLLRPGGIYIVEDLHGCYWERSHRINQPVFIDTIKKLIDDINSRGKFGVADIRKDIDDGWYIQKEMPEITWWEKNVEFLHLYRGIVFIKKYPLEKKLTNIFKHTSVYLTVCPVVPLVKLDYYAKKLYTKTKNHLKRLLILLTKKHL